MTTAAPVLRLRPGAPASVLAVAKARGVTLPAAYYGQLQGLARQLSFSIAGVAALDQLQAVKDSLDQALAGGDDFRAWKRRVLAGEIPLALPNHRLETIFRTYLQTTYSRGNGEHVLRNVDVLPYLLYSAVNDSRTRPAHSAMNGTILPVNDPWWATHRPPNGFNCRCRAIALSEREAKRRGITGSPPSGEGTEPDPGWDYDPWKDPKRGMREQIRRRRAKLTPKLADKLEDVQAKADAAGWANVATPADAIIAGREAIGRIFKAAGIDKLESTGDAGSFRDALVREIQAAHGAPVAIRVDKMTGSGAPQVRATLKAAADALPSTWVARANDYGPMRVAITKSRASMLTNRTKQTISTRNGAAIVKLAPREALMRTDASLDTAIHEFTHRIQSAIPDLDAIFQAHYTARTANEALARLAALLPRHGYRADEVARPDGFANPYFGKWYKQHAGALADLPFGALEMMTMTVEAILGSRSRLLDLWAKDPETFALGVGLLLRWRP